MQWSPDPVKAHLEELQENGEPPWGPHAWGQKMGQKKIFSVGLLRFLRRCMCREFLVQITSHWDYWLCPPGWFFIGRLLEHVQVVSCWKNDHTCILLAGCQSFSPSNSLRLFNTVLSTGDLFACLRISQVVLQRYLCYSRSWDIPDQTPAARWVNIR